MFWYHAFGLLLHSDVEFPELARVSPMQGAYDVRITQQQLGIIATADAVRHHFSTEKQTFIYPGVGAFVINGVDQVIIEPALGASSRLVALPLLGPVMGLLLHLRGLFVLHGSAVRIQGAGFGFLGDKGAGKSTLAAALLQEGITSLVSDDLLAFNDRAEIVPAFPQLKLSSEALAFSKGAGGTQMPSPSPDFPKKLILIEGEMDRVPVPTTALYELRRGASARIEPLAGAEALRTLIRFSYVSRFASRRLEAVEHQKLFKQAATIANTVQIGRLYVPDSLERLSQISNLLPETRA